MLTNVVDASLGCFVVETWSIPRNDRLQLPIYPRDSREAEVLLVVYLLHYFKPLQPQDKASAFFRCVWGLTDLGRIPAFKPSIGMQ